MKLLILSGLSGSGKSIALSTLEDLDYYCIDNLPVGMLRGFAEQITGEWGRHHSQYAVGIDARSRSQDLQHFPALLRELRTTGIDCSVFFLQSEQSILLKRFSETRRKHPLSTKGVPLADAMRAERTLLEPVAANADMFIDTSSTTVHQLRDLIRDRVLLDNPDTMSLLFESFGYKHGIPSDADFVFDVRCLPNPHWEAELRPLCGRDQPVIDYLERQEAVEEMRRRLIEFLEQWIPCFARENRSYMTIAIGCTGGQHRSVYLAEALARHFRAGHDNVMVRHRELS